MARLHRGGAGWRAVTLVVLLAFTLQSFITQTHIHRPPAAGRTPVSVQIPHRGNSPLDESTAACPFCQATIHAGAFFAPGSPKLLVPLPSAGVETYVSVATASWRAVAHNWHSRAPPPHRI